MLELAEWLFADVEASIAPSRTAAEHTSSPKSYFATGAKQMCLTARVKIRAGMLP